MRPLTAIPNLRCLRSSPQNTTFSGQQAWTDVDTGDGVAVLYPWVGIYDVGPTEMHGRVSMLDSDKSDYWRALRVKNDTTDLIYIEWTRPPMRSSKWSSRADKWT